MTKKNIAIPLVLKFDKKLVPSDGYISGTNWNSRDRGMPIEVQEKSIRGAISNRLKPALKNDPVKLNAKVENPNFQTVEQDTLKLHFTLKILGGILYPSACNSVVFSQSYQAAVNGYIKRGGFRELARRYALNIANARFLWRNDIEAEKIEVQVNALIKGIEQSWEFDSMQFSRQDLVSKDPQVNLLAEHIASVLISDDDFLQLDIACYALVGKVQEMYLSESILDKSNSKSKKNKMLYFVNGSAVIHSQEIGNALQPPRPPYQLPLFGDDLQQSIDPIAIELYGQGFFTNLNEFAQSKKLGCIEDEHYMMAVLISGGNFGRK